jgi:hypothetical protein
MKRLLCMIACAVLSLTLSPVAAAEGDARGSAGDSGKAGVPAPGAGSGNSGSETQQVRMKRCSEEAKKKELKGDERRGFMSTCLKGGQPRPAR